MPPTRLRHLSILGGKTRKHLIRNQLNLRRFVSVRNQDQALDSRTQMWPELGCALLWCARSHGPSWSRFLETRPTPRRATDS